MAAFDLGGDQCVIARRVLTAADQWIPHATLCTITDFGGVAILGALKAAVGADNGFFMAENVPVTIGFSDYGTSTGLCVQVRDPVGGAWLDAMHWVEDDPNPFKRLLGPLTEWRAGCASGGVLDGTPTVMMIYNKVQFGRHA